MNRPPRDPNSGIFTDKTLISVTYRGVLIGIAVIFAQWLGMQHSPEFGVAMSFSTLIWCRTLQTFPARSNTQTAIQAGFFSNRSVLLAVVVCSALYCLTMIPGLKEVFYPISIWIDRSLYMYGNRTCDNCFDGNH